MKKIIVALLSCITVASLAFAATSTKKNVTTKKPVAKAEMVIITDDEYVAGQEDPQLTAGLAGFLEAEPVVTKVSYSQAKEDAKYAQLDLSYMPLYLIKKTDAVREKFAEAIEHGYVQENNDFIILAHQTRNGVFTQKAAKPGVMEIFVMSQCPYCKIAEAAVIQANKDGKIPAGKEIQLHYLVDYDDANGFRSLHGTGEWEEDLRQLLIAKYYPKAFWKYIEIRNKDVRSSRWDKAMEEAGINVKKILSKFDTEGMELLKQEAKYANEYGINATPTFLYEGRVQLDFGSASKIEGFEFLDPNAVKP